MSQGVGQEGRKNERGRKKPRGIGREKEEGGERWREVGARGESSDWRGTTGERLARREYKPLFIPEHRSLFSSTKPALSAWISGVELLRTLFPFASSLSGLLKYLLVIDLSLS